MQTGNLLTVQYSVGDMAWGGGIRDTVPLCNKRPFLEPLQQGRGAAGVQVYIQRERRGVSPPVR